jgi:hypothetical protein
MRNVIDYANAVKDIVYDLTQENVLLDTKIEVGDEFTMSATETMKNVIITVPNEFNVIDEQDVFILEYINDLYGLELDKNDICDHFLFAILHEIGHVIDYSHKRNKWGKIGNAMLKRYSKKDNKIKDKLDDEYFKNMCAVDMLRDDLCKKQDELLYKQTQLVLERGQNLLSDNYDIAKNKELRREYDNVSEQYDIKTKEIAALNDIMAKIEYESSYNYRQVTTEYKADKWAAMMIKNYEEKIINCIYATASEIN